MVKRCLLMGLALMLLVSFGGVLGLTSCSCEKDGVSGKYFHEDDPESYLELYSDGTFYLYYDAGLDFGTRTGIRGGLDGTYRVKDDTIILSSSLGASKLLIGDKQLRDEQGKRWLKETAGTPAEKTTEITTVQMSPGETIIAFFEALREGRYSDAETHIAFESRAHDLEKLSDELGGNYSSLAEAFREIPQEDLPKRVEIADEDIIREENAEVDCKLYFINGDMDTISFALVRENLIWKLVLYPTDTESATTASPEVPSTPEPVTTPSPLAEIFDNGVIMGDFSITLGQLERESGTTRRLNALTCDDDYVRLYFAIRRVNDTADDGHLLATLDKIRIIDDHGNMYSNDGFDRLKWRDSVGDISFSSLPVGFTWIEAYDVVIPMLAPIVKIQLLSSYPDEIKWEIEYQEFQIKLPNLNAGYEERVLSIGQAVSYGEYLQWSVGSTAIINQEFVIPFNLSNLDYNAHELQLIISVQENNRQIRGGFYSGFGDEGGYCRISLPGRYPTVCHGFIKLEVPGQSKMEVLYQIPLGQELDAMPEKLLILSKDEKGVKESYIIDITP